MWAGDDATTFFLSSSETPLPGKKIRTMDSVSVARALLLGEPSYRAMWEQSYVPHKGDERSHKMSKHELSTSYSQSVWKNGLRLADGTFLPGSDEKLETCCVYALDKPTRLAGDLILTSENLTNVGNLQIAPNQTPLSEYGTPEIRNVEGVVGGASPNEFYQQKLDPKTTPAQSIKENVSDHLFVTRKVDEYVFMSANVSFAMRLGKPIGSEALFVKSVLESGREPKQMLSGYLDAMQSSLPHIMAFQEWVHSPEMETYLGGLGYQMIQTKSENEGSCIAIKSELSNEDLNRMIKRSSEDNELWGVAVKGRTFSAMVANIPQPTLILNLHGPNPSEAAEGGWYKKSDSEIATFKANKFCQYIPEHLKERFFVEDKGKAFRTNNQKFIEDWLSYILSPGWNNTINTIYEQCERRLVVMGDLNDASETF